MADVKPFRGLRYNLDQIGDPSAVISPPYDVISAEEQPLYHRKSPYNIIRLEFGEERSGDSAKENKYTRAAKTIERWLEEAILIQEGRPALYLVEHRFPYEDTVKSRWSLIARIRLENLGTGQVRLHERTMRGPARDRLHLLQSCHANLSPVMGLFRHHGEGVRSLFPGLAQDKPNLKAVDSYGVVYNLWVVTAATAMARVSDFFKGKILYVADGHHRYETALAYQKERRNARSSYTGDEAFNFVMMTLTDSDDPNLILLPTHRLVLRLKGERLVQLKEELPAYFDVTELLPPSPTLSETLRRWQDTLKERGQSGTTIGLYGLDGQCLRLLTGRQQKTLQEVMPADQPRPLKELDVNLLHRVILRRMLGIKSPEQEQNFLEYTRDGLEAVSRVDSGGCQLAFLLNPTPISSVLAVADAGTRMPPKSTYFYPKTPTGLVINPLWDD